MRVESTNLTSSQLLLKSRPVDSGAQGVDQVGKKTLGETPPVLLSLSEIGNLASLFAASGMIGRLRKKLNYLKKKKCKVVPAKGTIACVDDEDTVFLGVDFLEKYQDDEETLAGVLAHEWGHACALKPNDEELQKMSWNQIFETRKSHEVLADEISGRLLYMMGYTTKGITRFLSRQKDTHNLKYHDNKTRIKIIEGGFNAEKNKGRLARELFKKNSYKNEYDSVLLDIA